MRKPSKDKEIKALLAKRFRDAKARAEKHNLPFNITREYLYSMWNDQKGLCAISQIPMTFTTGSGRIFSQVSIDQIIPGNGYIMGNVQLVCSGVNQLKSDWDMETVYFICQNIINNINSL